MDGFYFPVLRRCLVPLVSILLLGGCASLSGRVPEPVPVKLEPYTKGYKVLRGHYKVGQPYTVGKVTYHPIANAEGYVEEGIASWYGNQFHGGLTANGERFDMHAISAAHTTLPLPTQVRITNLKNGRWTVARVNDRGPFVKGRLIDLSHAAAKELGFEKQGIAPVRIEALTPGKYQNFDGTGQVFKSKKAIDIPVRPKKRIMNAKSIRNGPAIAKPSRRIEREKVRTVKKRSRPMLRSKSNGRNGYFVQAGSFRHHLNAKKMAQELREAGNAHIQSGHVGNKTYYRVLFGPFTTPVVADGMVRTLSRLGINKPRIVRE